MNKSMKRILAEFREYSQKVNSLGKVIEARHARQRRLQEDREIFNEISRSSAENIYNWMSDTSGMPYDFEDLFDGAMRVQIPLASEESRNLAKLAAELSDAGWEIPRPEGMFPGVPPRRFPVKKVKQKLQRLAADGGGEYEIEVDVADLRLLRTTQKVIPAGPRKGETIDKKEDTTMSKAIARLAKSGKIGTDLLDWWQNNQNIYTRDGNQKMIEKAFEGDESTDYSIVISRHPIDVLRMSDISSIQSCHSEGSEYFHCAIAEAKGHGPIAYLVNSEELENHLMEEAEDLDPTQILGRAMNSLDRDEFREKMAKEFDLETPAGRWVYIETWAETRDGDKWLKELQQRIDVSSHPEKFKGQFMNAKAKQLGVPLEELAFYYRVWLKGDIETRPIPVKDAEYKKARKAVYGRKDAPANINPISDYDDQELFRDRDRGIKGIGAEARLRLRKFEEPMRFGTFAVPEFRMYGRHVPGFKDAVRKWAAEGQREQFVGDDGELSYPRFEDLTRRGGSYEDNKDGAILNKFLEEMYGPDTDFEGPYDDYRNASKDYEDEEDAIADANERLYEEYSEAVEELNRYAAQTLEHFSADASVDFYDEEAPPVVYGGGSLRYIIPLDWKGMQELEDIYVPGDYDLDADPYAEEAGQYIPKSYGGNYANRRSFEDALEEPVDYYPEETEWELIENNDGSVELQVTHLLRQEEGSDPDDFESFIDYIKELDDNYRALKEKIRRSLVENEFIGPSDWDNLEDDFSEMEETLENWKVYGLGDDDGEVWFRLQPDGSSSAFMKSGIKWPYSAGSRYSDTESLRGLFGGRQQSIGLQRYISFAPVPHSTGARGYGTPAGAVLFKRAFNKLQAAANDYAQRQLSLDFGPEYEKKFTPIEFGKNVNLGLALIDGQEELQLEVGFYMNVTVNSDDNSEVIEQTFNFVKFLDANMGMLKKTVMEAFTDRVLGFKEENDAAARRLSDGTALSRNLRGLRLSWEDAADEGREMGVAVMKVVMWAEQNFSKMQSASERIAITQVTRKIHAGRDGYHVAMAVWDEGKALPHDWDNEVKQVMVQQGATFTQKQKYNSSYLAGEPEGTTYSQDFSDGQPVNEPEAALRGTIGEPRPAGGGWQNEVQLKEEIYKRLQKKILKKKVKAHLVEKLQNQKELQKNQVRELVKSKLLELDIGYTQRTYKLNMRIAMAKEHGGKRDETENEIRGVEGVTTVKIIAGTTRQDAANYYADCMIKWILLGQQSVTQYIKGTLMPYLNKIEGLSILRVDQWEELKGLREYISIPGDVGNDRISPTPSIDQIAQSWAASGDERATQAMAHDLAQQVRQVTMIPVAELMQYLGSAGNMFSGTKNEFDDLKQKFISGYHVEPIMVAIGKNGRVKVVNGDDTILVAKDLGLEELPTVFSLQLQV
tara:strand:+ start:4260 stop:8465 length:4206 start_codon:yes stop_codon:yes gene_type:complete